MFLFLYSPSCHLIFSVSSTWLPHGKKAALLFLCFTTSQGENTQPVLASHFHRQPFSCCICMYLHASIKTFWSIFIFPIYKIIWAWGTGITSWANTWHLWGLETPPYLWTFSTHRIRTSKGPLVRTPSQNKALYQGNKMNKWGQVSDSRIEKNSQDSIDEMGLLAKIQYLKLTASKLQTNNLHYQIQTSNYLSSYRTSLSTNQDAWRIYCTPTMSNSPLL